MSARLQVIKNSSAFWMKTMQNMVRILLDFQNSLSLVVRHSLGEVRIIVVKPEVFAFLQKGIDSITRVDITITHHAGKPYRIFYKIFCPETL